MKKTLFAMTLLFSALLSANELSSQALKAKNHFDNNVANIWSKKNAGYELNIFSMQYFNKDGEPISIDHKRIKNESFALVSRVIKIPVKAVANISGFDKSIQLLGAGDTDVKTGGFKHIEGKKIIDLFSKYSGKTFNLGLGVFGGGRSKSENQNGIVFSDFNFSLILSPPGGAGLNLGLTASNFDLKFSPVLKVNLVETNITIYDENGNIAESKKYEEAVSNGEILNIDL